MEASFEKHEAEVQEEIDANIAAAAPVVPEIGATQEATPKELREKLHTLVESFPKPDISEKQPAAAAAAEPAPVPPTPHPEVPIPPTPHLEVPVPPELPPHVESHIVVNASGLKIPTTEAHIYANTRTRQLYVYGSTPAEQEAKVRAFLKDNPEAVVIGSDDSGACRIPWHVVDGVVTTGPIMKREEGGFFNRTSTQMEPPGVEEFDRVVI